MTSSYGRILAHVHSSPSTAHGLHAGTHASGVEKGIEEDDMVALEMGTRPERMSDTQKLYAEKIKEKLIERAAELKVEEEARLEKMAKTYLLGKEAYE